MAAQPFTPYSNAVLELSRGSFDLASDTLAMILATDAYTPSPADDVTYSDVSAFEVPNSAVTLSGLSDTLTGGTVTFTASPALWEAFTGTFRYAVIVRRDGSSLIPSDLLLCCADCSGGGSITGAGGTLSITPDVSGILTLVHSP